jgi:hypothetical protein
VQVQQTEAVLEGGLYHGDVVHGHVAAVSAYLVPQLLHLSQGHGVFLLLLVVGTGLSGSGGARQFVPVRARGLAACTGVLCSPTLT